VTPMMEVEVYGTGVPVRFGSNTADLAAYDAFCLAGFKGGFAAAAQAARKAYDGVRRKQKKKLISAG